MICENSWISSATCNSLSFECVCGHWLSHIHDIAWITNPLCLLLEFSFSYALPVAKAQAVAQETLLVWCSLASRLGLWALKAEMEDLCFAVLQVWSIFSSIRICSFQNKTTHLFTSYCLQCSGWYEIVSNLIIGIVWNQVEYMLSIYNQTWHIYVP